MKRLPPSREQVRELVEERSPDAWPKLIDKLLASPHYGEKWGRHWLDLVRYSDTAGFELDSYIHDCPCRAGSSVITGVER